MVCCSSFVDVVDGVAAGVDEGVDGGSMVCRSSFVDVVDGVAAAVEEGVDGGSVVCCPQKANPPRPRRGGWATVGSNNWQR